MKAIMLAAGIGRRLGGDVSDLPPKALLRFDGQTLLQRHIDVLRGVGIQALTLVVGYRAGDIAAEIAAIGARSFVTTIHNPNFTEGSLVSLWAARAALTSGEDILFMDADVLYDPALIERLVDTEHRNAFLIDRDFEPGDEPVKLCLRNGVLAEFRKKIDGAYDVIGEWPGFLRLAPAEAAKIAAALDRYVATGRRDQPYEEPMRDVLLADPQAFGIEDITGTPWIEIDFPEDLARAEREILPLLRIPVPRRAAG